MTSSAPPYLMTLAAQEFDRSAGLFDRSISVPGIKMLPVQAGLRPGVNGVIQGIFDAAEMPLARYLWIKDQGDPVTAVPVFPDRLMLHQYIYTRPDTGITTLADLRGRKVMLTGYFVTASFWHREFLREEGIAPEEVEWYTSAPELDERMVVPEGIRLTMIPGPGMRYRVDAKELMEGIVDVMMTEGTPRGVSPGDNSSVRRLFEDTHHVQYEHYKKTHIHPITHVIVVRKEALEAWPQFGYELCRAYDLAKGQAYARLQDERRTSLPLMRDYLDESLKLFGNDPWPYGIEANRPTLQKYLEIAFKDGFTRRQYAIEELFDEQALAYEFQSKMNTGMVVA